MTTKSKTIAIGICGGPNSGKSTIADFLVKKHGFTEFSFADRLKKLISTISDFSYEFLKYPKEKIDRETIKDHTMGLCAREYMQKIGTMFREYFSADFWIKLLSADILKNGSSRIVISDCRYQNEIDYVLGLPGSVLFIIDDSEDSVSVISELQKKHDSNYSFIKYIKVLEKGSNTKGRLYFIHNQKGQLQNTYNHIDCLFDNFL